MMSLSSLRRPLLALFAAGLGASAVAQAPGDFPSLKGNSARTGRSGDPLGTGPGSAPLRWFFPASEGDVRRIVVDNTDHPDASSVFPSGNPRAYVGQPYTPNALGTTEAFPFFFPGDTTPDSSSEWVRSPQPAVDDVSFGPTAEASFSYVPVLRDEPVTVGGVTYPANSNARQPAYVYTQNTPSALGSDPTVAAQSASRRYFEWRFRGPTGQRQYGISVYLPIGPTRLNEANLLFPQRYNVYEVIYGSGQRYVQVVDTYAAGAAWVRLGAQGDDPAFNFTFDGTNDIRVRLYNTIPRDSNGNLLDQTGRVVYADAMRALPDVGNYVASPIVASDNTGSVTRVVGALNAVSTEQNADGTTTTRTRGVISSFVYNFPLVDPPANRAWQYVLQSPTSGEGDYDNEGAEVTRDPGWTRITQANFVNGDFRRETAILSADGSGATGVTYAPALVRGEYDLYAWVPGNQGANLFAREVRYEITDYDSVNETPRTTAVFVNQAQNQGWVRLGSRRFLHRPGLAEVTVRVTNATAEAADAGLSVQADAVRFVGQGSVAVDSTPVEATVGLRTSAGPVVQTRVVVVADEGGRIQALDGVGRGDGTTTVYWTYPTPANITPDPNLTEGIDGPAGTTLPSAEMPTGFSTSSALVQRINGVDYLYIASRNGRVYCLEMAGRGDYDANARRTGTTRRVWSWPQDYPVARQAGVPGGIVGSVSFADTAQGPTLFVTSGAGRVYALDALPTDPGLVAARTTDFRWQFPGPNDPPAGAVTMTPSVEFNRVFFGYRQLNDNYPRFVSLSADNGDIQWVFPRDDADFTQASNQTSSWLAGPATVPTGLLGGGMPDTVFCHNENGYTYAINAGTGDLIWTTGELNSGCIANLTFTQMQVFANNGALTTAPVVLVPTENGRFVGLFARVGDTNRRGTRRAYEYQAGGEAEQRASLAVGQGWMFGADSLGYLYGFSDNTTGFPGSLLGFAPGQGVITENDLRGDLFRYARTVFVSKSVYDRLTLGNDDIGGSAPFPRYQDLFDPVTRNPLPGVALNRAPNAFEWGETVYVLVYNFPYVRERTNGGVTVNIPGPTVNLTFSVEGQTARTQPVPSRQFRDPETAPPNQADPSYRDDGFAAYAYVFQGSGPNALPPGNATVSASISTQALGTGALQQVALDDALTIQRFQLANPLAVYVGDVNGNPLNQESIGFTKDPSNAQNLVNGSPNLGLGLDRILSTAGQAQHGSSATARMWVVDRSMMGLIRPDGEGLDGVRVNRALLQWQGGASTVFKALDPAVWPGFEELPNRLPNVSLDYPDIRPESVRVVKDPNGTAENPVFAQSGVTLPAATVNVGGAQVALSDPSVRTAYPNDNDLLAARNFRPVPFDFTVNVPRYQSANTATINNGQAPLAASTTLDPRFKLTDSAGRTDKAQGYIGRYGVYVDSTQNGVLDEESREAFRAFSISTSVMPDQRFRVVTPTVNPSTGQGTVELGSLPAGTGYLRDPSLYNPRVGSGSLFLDLFKPYSVINEGNVNLRNVRLAKETNVFGGDTPVTQPFAFGSSSNDVRAWLDSSLDLRSNFEPAFAPQFGAGGDSSAIIQKARVGDTVPTQLVVNPSRRENANTGVVPGTRDGGLSDSPRVSVTIPLGFPVGTYAQTVRIIENEALGTPGSEFWERLNGGNVESYTDPSFTLIFGVRESRLTNRPTKYTDVQVDALTDGTERFAYRNAQPTMMRTARGALALAWASDRPSATPTPATPAETGADARWRIYFATLASGATFTPTSVGTPGDAGYSSIRDLNFFTPGTDGFWRKPNALANGFPVASADFGGTLVPGSDRYYLPSLPATGVMDPYAPTNLSQAFGQTRLAFVGQAIVQTAAGRETATRVFVANVAVDDAGNLSAGTPFALPGDDATAKGRPTVVMVSPTQAVVIYPETSANGTALVAVPITGDVPGTPVPLAFGSGFASVAEVAATLRPVVNGLARLEIVLTGQLKGAAVRETFLTRLALDPSDLAGSLAGRFGGLVRREGEILRGLGSGQYAATGVGVDLGPNSRGLAVNLRLGGATSDLVVPGTLSIDPETGVVSFDSTLGGRGFFDPTTGRLRLAVAPARTGQVLLSYTPGLLRLSESQANYGSPTVVFDPRRTSDPSDFTYWVAPTGSSDIPTNDRLVVFATRGGGNGQAPRPVMKTLRPGVRLPSGVYTDDAGRVSGLSVAGLTGAYQVDPIRGRVYVTSVDEGKQITVTYTPADPATGAPGPAVTVTATVDWTTESPETLVPIEQAVNEGGITAFADPFDPQSNDERLRRPALYWLVWASTRAGVPDLYFQTVAPRLGPLPVGR